MKIQLPEAVQSIICALTKQGYEAYAVGGCVRDSIIHREPKDWDITTSATPNKVKEIFHRTIDTGIAHGTVTVMMDQTGYEVTTYRIDGEYEDLRHPKSVEFTASLTEDLKRRDFTINAMAYNDETGLVDEFGGVNDLENGIIRCVGKAEDRFGEDALRMLRAVRFCAQLGFTLEEETACAIKKLAHTISGISKERIHTEFNKILLSPNPGYIMKAYELGITGVVLPVFDKMPDKEGASKLLYKVPKELIFRYAALLYEAGSKEAANVLRELKSDNKTITGTARIVELHGMKPLSDEILIRQAACRYGIETLINALEFEKCYYSVSDDREKEAAIQNEKRILDEIIDRGDCIDMKGLAVTGKDLIGLGIEPGQKMGEILKECLDIVLKDPSMNDRDRLLQKINIK